MLPAIPKLSNVAPGICRVLGMNPGPYTLQGTNSYIVGSDSAPCRLMIDTSDAETPEYIKNVEEYFADHKTARISDIILTHWHHDHVGSIPDILALARAKSWPQPRVHKFPSRSNPDSVKEQHQPLVADQVFDLAECGLGSSQLRVHFCPGHTDDHIALQLHPAGVFFSGDLVLGHGSSVFEKLTSYLDSLHRARSWCADVSLMLPGHGLQVTDVIDKIDEYIGHRTDRIVQLKRALSCCDINENDLNWLSESQLLKRVYPENVLADAALFRGALMNQYLVLQYLLEHDEVACMDVPKSDKSGYDTELSISNKLWGRK